MAIKCPKCQTDNPDTLKFCGECGTQLISTEEVSAPTKTLEAAREELTRGTTFANRYEIIEELGKGGMGKVYRVEDKKIKEEVALKLIKPEIASDKKTIERFSNELKIARKIAHRNVCKMYDLGEEKGTHYITMEYVPGEDLKSTIKRVGPLGAGKTIFIAKQVCDGLKEAHNLGVVHRDLKPSNIMIDKEGNTRIMDFGIARSISGKGITGAGVMIGTPEYMSPEQAEVKEVDQRSDIYSLGVILYEMMTGRVPFEGETPLGIAMKHKSEVPKDPKEINTQIPEDLSSVILKCLEKNKEKRYQNAGEVHSELERIEKGIPLTEKVIPRRKPITSREITVTVGLKKIFIPALVIVALVIAGVIIWQVIPRKETIPTPSGKPSIAVLPFEDLSPQKDQGYLCDGFAESLISSLTKIKNLRVPARTSSFSFKEKERNIQEIGEKLNVKTILEGSVQKAGNRLRITTKLINVDDESLIWSEQYSRDLDDVFAIQDEITLAIVDKLKLNLLGKEKTSIVKRHTENLEAFNLYLQGRFFWNKRTEEGAKKAIEHFEQSIEKDPSYALAYTGLADSYLLLPFYANISPKEVFPKAKEAVRKALEIDNSLSEAHTSMAMIKSTYDWDWVGAEKEFKLAIELNPSYATAHHWYAWFLMWTARFDEALEEIERARELDPLSLIINRDTGGVSFIARQYEQTIEILQKMLEMSPNFPQTRVYLARAYILKSMYDKALAVLLEEKELIGLYPLLESWLGVCYMKMGQKTKSQEVLNQLIQRSEQEYVSSFHIALIYFAQGENDQGFKRLEQAYNERTGFLSYLKTEPILDNLRSDPRFQDLMQRMNFPE